MLADTFGDFRELALVRTDGGEVAGLADEVEGAKGFPDLFVARIDGGDFCAGGHGTAGSYREDTNAAADGRAEFGRLFAILQFGNQAALMDGGSQLVHVGDVAGDGRNDFGGLQESDDLRAACGVAEANERQCRISAHHG